MINMIIVFLVGPSHPATLAPDGFFHQTQHWFPNEHVRIKNISDFLVQTTPSSSDETFSVVCNLFFVAYINRPIWAIKLGCLFTLGLGVGCWVLQSIAICTTPTLIINIHFYALPDFTATSHLHIFSNIQCCALYQAMFAVESQWPEWAVFTFTFMTEHVTHCRHASHFLSRISNTEPNMHWPIYLIEQKRLATYIARMKKIITHK